MIGDLAEIMTKNAMKQVLFWSGQIGHSCLREDRLAIRDSMQASASPYLHPGEKVQAVFGAQTASQWLAALTGVFIFLGLNKYRIFVVTSERILVLDAGKASMAKAKGVVMELARATKLGPDAGLWHVIPAGDETLRVHRRFFRDIETADTQAAA